MEHYMNKAFTNRVFKFFSFPCFLFCAGMCSIVFAADAKTGENNPSKNTSYDADVFIDLSNPATNSIIVPKSGPLKVLIVNMIPSQVKSYYVLVDAVSFTPTPFVEPELDAQVQEKIEKTKETLAESKKAHSVVAAPNDCQQPEAAFKKIRDATTSQEVAIAVAEGRTAIFNVDPEKENCDDFMRTVRAAIALTERQVEVSINHDYDARVTVSLNSTSNILATSVIQPTRKQWITSYGFGFVDNRDENYFSKGNATDGYVINKQEERNQFTYTALAMFTYPFHPYDNGLELGFTGGIGASQENIAALAGVSLVVNKNFIITGGVSFQEFNILKGQYNEGDNIGNVPIDSDVLEDKTYKAAAAIVLSYRFGAGGSGSK